MTKLPGHLRRGGCSFLLHRWTAEKAMRLMSAHRMTNLGGVPTQLALLLRHPDLDRYDLSSVQSIVLGGGPAPLPLLREATQRFGAPVSVRYSSTESGGCGTGTAFEDPLDDDLGVGLPRGPVELAIRTEDGNPVPTGEVGEICLRSPTAMTGYFKDEAATAAAFWADGYVRTGDLGYVNDRGRLFLAGRGKEMYVRGGYNVYPMEVEAVLLDHPQVAAVAVIARPDDVLGEQGVAVVVPTVGAPPPTIDELRGFAKERLSSYKLPDDVHLVDALPLTAGDKVDRRSLESLLNAGR
jgi:acyl-CoA synthetase (AMP-forming)/AMP-acid ligase II